MCELRCLLVAIPLFEGFGDACVQARSSARRSLSIEDLAYESMPELICLGGLRCFLNDVTLSSLVDGPQEVALGNVIS